MSLGRRERLKGSVLAILVPVLQGELGCGPSILPVADRRKSHEKQTIARSHSSGLPMLMREMYMLSPSHQFILSQREACSEASDVRCVDVDAEVHRRAQSCRTAATASKAANVEPCATAAYCQIMRRWASFSASEKLNRMPAIASPASSWSLLWCA